METTNPIYDAVFKNRDFNSLEFDGIRNDFNPHVYEGFGNETAKNYFCNKI